MNLIRSTSYHPGIKRFFIWFYSIGFIGFAIPYTHRIFSNLIPYALLLSFIIALWYHRGTFGRKSIFIFLTIFTGSFAIEAIGIHTGLIFGSYHYGQSLGLKLFNTPVLIGLNWLMLAYYSGSLAENLKAAQQIKVLAASVLMLAYDLVMEQVAPLMDMWYWENNRVPLQNYMVWFGVAMIIHAILKLTKISLHNRIAPFVFICQFACLFALWMYDKLFI